MVGARFHTKNTAPERYPPSMGCIVVTYFLQMMLS